MSTTFLYGIVMSLLLASFIKDKKKTKMALKKAWKSIKKNIRMIAMIMMLMGVVLAILDENFITKIFGQESGLLGILLGLSIGSISFMPSIVAFPLGATLLENGAGYQQIAGFISSLMGVGMMSIGMEIQYFGKKLAITRNLLALAASIVFVIVVGGILI